MLCLYWYRIHNRIWDGIVTSLKLIAIQLEKLFRRKGIFTFCDKHNYEWIH